MSDRMKDLTECEVQQIHDASMRILETVGVCFNSHEASELFRHHGYKFKGNNVLITEGDVTNALETVPSIFTIQARNKDRKVSVGEDDFVLLPTLGAPNVALRSGELRPATMTDFQDCCKLVQTSPQLDMGGWLMVQPNDVPVETSHLDMLLAYFIHCDKPLLGAFGSRTMATDTFEMAKMVFGNADYLRKHPVTAMAVNTLTPLQFSKEQSEVILEASDLRQPVVISNMALAGSTAPVRLAGLLALINAEILAGLTLSQLKGAGTPIVYGTTSAPMDMKTCVGAVGAWETMKIASAAIQMARYYNLPCRTGGSLTDAHCPDAQALAEGSLLLSTALRNGAHFILHACGQVGSFISMSFEKWLIDEETCSLVRKALAPLEISESAIDIDTICDVGIGGNYLTHPSTFANFKNLSQPIMFNRSNNQRWIEKGATDVSHIAYSKLAKRLDGFEAPPMDEGLKQELKAYVVRRKQGWLKGRSISYKHLKN